MTRKHYTTMARALFALRPEDVELTARDMMTQWRLDVSAIAHVCAADNPAFSMARFLKACGYEGDIDR